ncbi:MAG: hypothetical protein V1797_04725 [Pseudomonadota bacterium]
MEGLQGPIESKTFNKLLDANQPVIVKRGHRRKKDKRSESKVIDVNQWLFNILWVAIWAILILLSAEIATGGIKGELGCPPKRDQLVKGDPSQVTDGTPMLPEKGRPARPGELGCPVPLPGKWQPQEIWAWERICKGENVDFDRCYRGKEWVDHYRRGWNALKEPEKSAARLEWTNWDEFEKNRRRISADLLYLILFHEPWKSAIGNNGVKIYGAYFEEEINLISANINHDLWLNYCVLKGGFKAGHIRAGRTIALEGSTIKKVEMGFGRIEGLVTFSKATVLDGISIEQTWISKTLYLEYCKFCKECSIYSIDELKVIASPEEINNSKKLKVIKLALAGVTVKSFSCNVGYWPSDTYLDTFEYGALCGDDGLAFWSPKDIINLLGTQKVYSPQPYEQCAKVLREAGQPEKANEVLFAGKERERDQTWKDNKLRWVGMTMLRAVIGYGLGARYFLSLTWAALLVWIGAFIAKTTKLGTERSFFWLTGYSLAKLLPLVKYGDEFDKSVGGWQQGYFIFHQLMGWVLASFVVAGMAGLTK